MNTQSHFSTVWVDPTHKRTAYPGFNGDTNTIEDGIYKEVHEYVRDPKRIGKVSYYKYQ